MSDTKQNAIPYTKERCLKAAIAELVDDYETLKREANELREHNKYLESRVSEESDYAALLTRHNALVEAVAWLRGVDDVRERFAAEFPWIRRWSSLDQYVNEARAEVDRLIANEGADDCKGEG